MNKKFSFSMQQQALALALASGLALAPQGVDAAGLGRITVYSGLGQPLRAEIQINATKDELVGMSARLATEDSFRQAKVDRYSPSLGALRFAVERRSGNSAIVKVTSSKPINDPFLDFLVELDWPSGRLVRQYTFLLDPPEVLQMTPIGAPTAGAPSVRERVRAPGEAGKAAAVDTPARTEPAAAVGEHVVKRGETLRKIASENMPEGVSMEQMLVALYRNNPDAFIGKNMNLLRTGAVLQIPSQEAVAAIPAADARNTFRTQTAAWQKLPGAGTQPRDTPIRPVGPSATPSSVPDNQVVVSSNAPRGGGPSQEDFLVKQKELEDSQAQVAILKQNVDDLKRIVDDQQRKLAELEAEKKKNDESIGTPPPADQAPVVEVPPVDEPTLTPTEEPPVVTQTEPVAPPVEEPAVVEPPPAPPPPPPPPPPIEEPEEEDSSALLWAGGGILALALAALGFVFTRRKKSGPSQASDEDEETVLDKPSVNESHSIFQETRGQSVDTSATTKAETTSDFTGFTKGTGAFDAGDVDPINEADLYLGYGKDAQAEEILLDALQKEPHRIAISLKLLEVYALRKGAKQFDALATEVHDQTGGKGEDWDKVVALGLEVNPSNPLYGGAGSGAAAGPAPEFSFSTTDIDLNPESESEFDFGDEMSKITQDEATLDALVSAQTKDLTSPSVDVDLDFASEQKAKASFQAEAPAKVEPVDDEIPMVAIPEIAPSPPPQRAVPPKPEPKPEPPPPVPTPASALFGPDSLTGPDSLAPDVDFEAALTESTVLEGMTDSFFSGLDLDLSGAQKEGSAPATPEQAAAAPAPSAAPAGGVDDSRRDEVNTKLELAQAYEDMGDLEGARELLGEVVNEGAPDQVEQAKAILGRLSG